MLQEFQDRFYLNFIADDRWKYLVNGLKTTLTVTFFAVLIGIVLGFIVAIVRSTCEKTGKLRLLNAVCKVYLTVIRGTPVVVQLLIIYFVIFGSVNIDKTLVAILAFGLNSGAYVAEIIRGGIMSIEGGQLEAGRSLGLGYGQTMIYVILPQVFKNVLPALGNEFIVLLKETSVAGYIALEDLTKGGYGQTMIYVILPQVFKNVLPALGNEFIVLLKETSVAGYIALEDLTKGGDIIRSRTYDAFMPLIAVALIYLAMVLVFSKLLSILERRLRNNERR